MRRDLSRPDPTFRPKILHPRIGPSLGLLTSSNEFARCVRGRGCSSRKSQACGVIGWRGIDCSRVRTQGSARIRGRLWPRLPAIICSRFTTIRHPKRRECAECVKIGAQWVHLRTCQECGTTLCCDDSPNQHATKHAHASKHPVIASAEPGERWIYCYPHDAFAEY
jgi:hypothetical protein